MNLGMHLEAVIKRVWRCTGRPGSPKTVGVLKGGQIGGDRSGGVRSGGRHDGAEIVFIG
jgi:hypothetical protein